ncbi:MAG: MCE family protein, partial [Bacteroidetes bacterium]
KYPDVQGLLRGSGIMVNGFKVGKVTELELNFEEKYVMVHMEFDQKLDIPNNAEAIIYSVDLLGTKGIKIAVPDSIIPSKIYLNNGDEIAGATAAGPLDKAQNMVLDDGARILLQVAELSLELKKILQQTNVILNDKENQSILKTTLLNVQTTSQTLTSITGRIDSLAHEINGIANNSSSIVSNIEGNNPEITRIIDNVKSTSDSLLAATDEIKRLVSDASSAVGHVEGMVTKLDTTGGTLGLLLNDRQLYDSLTNTTERVNSLLREIESNPQRFFDDIKIYLIERKPPKSVAKKEENP